MCKTLRARHCSTKESLGKLVQYPLGALTPRLSNRTQLPSLYPPSSTIIHFNQVSGIITFPSTEVIFLGLISQVSWFAGLGAKHAAALHIPPLLKWNKMPADGCIHVCLMSKKILRFNEHSLQWLSKRNTQELSDQVFLQDNSIFTTASHYNSFYVLVLPWHQSTSTNQKPPWVSYWLCYQINKDIFTQRGGQDISPPLFYTILPLCL